MKPSTALIEIDMKTSNRIFAVGYLLANFFGAAAMAGDLTVEVAGITELKGDVLIAVYNQKASWLKTAVLSQKKPANNNSIVFTFGDLPEGEYAITAYQDLNQNGMLDVNAMGIPKEPYGFSNDAEGVFGPATYDQSKFAMGKAQKAISFHLN
jgi:uncharacterized protein (DUF2141 family)